jgi:hypothetical protein
VVPFQSQWTTDQQDPLYHCCMQQPVKKCPLGVCQQNNLWVLMFLVYFFTLQSSHSKTCGTTHKITNCSWCSHTFWYGSRLVSSGRRELCLYARWSEIWISCMVYPHLPLCSVVCCLEFYTSRRTKAKHFHCQGMFHGIHGGDSHGFVHIIRVTMSIEPTLYWSSLESFYNVTWMARELLGNDL